MKDLESDNLCDDCEYIDSDPNRKPCSVCIQWVDGYLSATQYTNKYIKEIGLSEVEVEECDTKKG